MVKAPITCVVFDFDGTLVDSNHIKRNVFFEIARRYQGGFEVMKRVYARAPRDRFAIWHSWAIEMGADQALADDMAADYSASVDKAVATTREMPGALAMLKALKAQSLTLILSSATPRANLFPIIDSRGWLDYFDAIYGAPETKAEILTRHVVPLAGDASRVAVVGDGCDDRESAQLIGCRFFPVGEARGASPSSSEHIYTLPELANFLGLQPNRKLTL